jgi:hypothetical protein
MLVIESPLRPEAIAARIGGELDAPGAAGFTAAGVRPWIGRVSASSLEMWRRIPYRSSFLPIVRARFVGHAGGTQATVTMSLALVTRLVLAGWFFLATVSSVGLVRTGEPVLLLPPVLLVAVVVLAIVGFNHEANAAEAYLKQRLDV